MGYVDGSNICPSTAQTVSHNLWIRQDQLLLHAILASISPQVISLIASAKTSKEAWDKLLHLFASEARAHVRGLKERLTLLRRDREHKSVSGHIILKRSFAFFILKVESMRRAYASYYAECCHLASRKLLMTSASTRLPAQATTREDHPLALVNSCNQLSRDEGR